MAKRTTTLLQRIRVPMGFVFAALFIVFAAPSGVLLTVGLGIAFCGLVLRAWSTGHIRKNQQLAVSGPYSRTRNPLYLGSFIMGSGFMVASGVWWLVILFAVLFLGIYLPVMRIEARELTQIFGEEYTAYSKSVPLFVPGVRAYGDSGNSFDFGLYLRYKEYQAAIGYIFIAAVLILKIYLLK